MLHTQSTSATPFKAPPVPISSEILRKCPRFRLLVIGNTGDGKSTLIRKAFGNMEVIISDTRRGEAEIDREFDAADNMPFVLHDSLGFEAGENFTIGEVKRFIKERRAKKDLKDRLHAVWLCVAVPYAHGRFLEAGTEEILRERKELLGDIPVIVVLTKVDLLDKTLLIQLCEKGTKFESLEQALEMIQSDRANFLKKDCEEPLFKFLNSDIPRVTVSAESRFGLEETIPELVRTTSLEIERYIKTQL